MQSPGKHVPLGAGLLLALVPWATAPASEGVQEAPASRSDRQLVGELSYGYSTGDYGTETDTDLHTVTARLRWLLRRAELRIALPYVHMSNEGNVVLVGGQPVAPGGFPLLDGLLPPLGGGDSSPPGDATSSERRTESVSGNGDVKARAEVLLLEGTTSSPWLSAVAEVKAPTGDESKGLGTGETDVTAGLGLVQPLGRASALLDGSYTRLGDPEGVDLDDVVSLGAGLAIRAGEHPGRQLYAYLENRTHPIAGLEDRRDLLVGFSSRFGEARQGRLSVGLAYGLSETAEQLGVTFGLGRAF